MTDTSLKTTLGRVKQYQREHDELAHLSAGHSQKSEDLAKFLAVVKAAKDLNVIADAAELLLQATHPDFAASLRGQVRRTIEALTALEQPDV